jgi:hypothetical protein
MAMSPRTTPTEITTKNKKEISNRNSAEAESDSSIDLAIKEFVGAVGKAGRQYVMLSGMRSFRLSIENFMYAALLREYMRIETIIKEYLNIWGWEYLGLDPWKYTLGKPRQHAYCALIAIKLHFCIEKKNDFGIFISVP